MKSMLIGGIGQRKIGDELVIMFIKNSPESSNSGMILNLEWNIK